MRCRGTREGAFVTFLLGRSNPRGSVGDHSFSSFQGITRFRQLFFIQASGFGLRRVGGLFVFCHLIGERYPLFYGFQLMGIVYFAHSFRAREHTPLRRQFFNMATKGFRGFREVFRGFSSGANKVSIAYYQVRRGQWAHPSPPHGSGVEVRHESVNQTGLCGCTGGYYTKVSLWVKGFYPPIRVLLGDFRGPVSLPFCV